MKADSEGSVEFYASANTSSENNGKCINDCLLILAICFVLHTHENSGTFIILNPAESFPFLSTVPLFSRTNSAFRFPLLLSFILFDITWFLCWFLIHL